MVIAGRPNVGKSTLVNRIVGRRAAVVEERPGVTRDRKELDAEWCGHPFTVVDTGGWLSSVDPLDAQVTAQAERAIAEADVVLLVVDVTVGVIDEDMAVARVLKRSGRPVRVVVNKVDSSQREADAWDAMSLGLGDPWPISALHGRGTGDLLDDVVRLLPEPAPTVGRHREHALEPTDGGPGPDGAIGAEQIPRVALVGRPNVGKSTLFNRLVGDERSVTHDAPGTTRDAVDTVVETPEGTVCFIDTAGMRRKSRTERGTEYFSVLRALDALDRADIALLIIDATAGVTHQDQRLAERIGAAGCPTVVVLNKWELIATEDRNDILIDIGDRLAFLGEAPVLKISALVGPRRPQHPAGGGRGRGGLPLADPDRRAQPGPQVDPDGPSAGRREDPVRGAGGQRPADVHPVHQRPPAAHLPPVRRARPAGAVRARPDPDQAAGAGQGSERWWGSKPMSRPTGPGGIDGCRAGGRPCPPSRRGVRTVPWCEQCDQRLDVDELADDGTCPTAGPSPSSTGSPRGTSSSCWWPASSTSATGPSRA